MTRLMRMKRTKASKPAFFIVSDIRCLEFIHLTGWYFKKLAMSDSLTDYDMVRAAYLNARSKADG